MVQKSDQIDGIISNVLFDTSFGICLTNQNGTILRVNQFFCNLVGYSSDELEGANFFSLLPVEYIEKERTLHELVWEKDHSYKSLIKLLKKDGTFIDLDIDCRPIQLEDEKLKLATIQDVTELVLLNELMKKVGEQTKVGGWERDLIADTITWTDGIFRIYDLPVGEIPRFGDQKLLEFFTKDDLEALIESHNYTIRTGSKSEIVTPFTSAKGVRKWIKNTTEALYVNGVMVKLFGTFQDITDEKEKELHIHESRIRYKYLFDNNPNPLLLIEQFDDFSIVDVNEAACRLYGYSKDEFIGLSALALRPEEEMDYFLEKMKTEYDSSFGENFALTRHYKKNREILNVEVHWTNLNFDGRPIRLVLCNDITERVTRDRELLETNAILSTLIESAPIAVVMVDKDANVELWNHRAEEIFGWKREEVLGKGLPYVPEDKVNELRENLSQGLSSQQSLRLELERVTKKGKTIYLHEYVTPISNESGESDKLMLLIEDITESRMIQTALVESELNYRNLVEASNDLILKMDATGTISFVNKAVVKILGFTPENLIGKNFEQLIHQEHVKNWIELVDSLNKGQSIESYDLYLCNSADEPVFMNGTFQPTFDQENQVNGYSWFAVDLTQLIEHQRHLENMLHEKEILIKEIHHRVKNNLAVVSGLLSLQSMSISDEKTLRILTESQSRIKSIATIHEKLYQNELFTRIEIKSYLKQLVEDIRDTYKSPEREIVVEVTGDDIYLNVNQAVPFGILTNELVVNSFKYAFRGLNRGRIMLNLKKKQEGKVVFEVSDNGVGLPQDFDKTSNKSLGMTLVRNLSKQLDADFTFMNDKGATFSLQFFPLSN